MQTATQTVTITTRVKELLAVLKQVKAALPKSKAAALRTAVEITVTTNQVTFAVPGAIFTHYCQTQGSAKASLLFHTFYDVLKNSKAQTVEIEITDGALRTGNLTLNARTCFFETDRILRSIQLPINYNVLDLLRIKEEYTLEELKFNDIYHKICRAEEQLEEAIEAAYRELKKFDVSEAAIRDLALRSVFSDFFGEK